LQNSALGRARLLPLITWAGGCRLHMRTPPATRAKPGLTACRFSPTIPTWLSGELAEHWDVLQDEATQAESASGPPMFGARFPA
jgi:hypothetical protein